MPSIRCPECNGELKYSKKVSYINKIYGKGGWYERLHCSDCNWMGQHVEFE